MTASGIGVGNLFFTIGGNRVSIDQTIQQLRTDVARQPLQVKLAVDEAASRRSLDSALKGLQGKTVSVGAKLESTALNAELAKLRGQSLSLTVKLAGLSGVTNDVNTLKTLLGTVGTNMQYRVTVNTTALSALNTQINTQIVQLQALISQLRALGGSGGPRPGGAGGGGISTANRQLLSELEALNNQWKRGDINAAAFGSALTGLQARLRAASAGATAGTADFRALDAGLTRLTGSLRSINTDAFQKLRTEAGAMRAAFDSATAGVDRNSAAFRAASATYSTSSATLISKLQALAASGTLTTQQLGQVNRELQRLAREANTIAGGINHAGLSGSVVNSFGALGGQFGMVISQGMAMIGVFKNIQATAGVTAVAMTALGGAGLVAGGALVALGGTGLKEVQKLQQGLNILQANGVQDLGAVQSKIKELQDSLGTVGQAFTEGELTLAMADIIKAGVSADDALTLMASSTRLAAAEQINLNDASGLLLKNIRQYQGDVSQAAKVGDMLAKAGNLAAGSANDLSVGLGIVAGTGMQAGIEMNNLLGQLIELDNKGMSAADVGANGLRAAIAALADITVKGQGVLKGLGIEINGVDGKARPAGDIMEDLGDKMRGMGITVDKTTGTLSGNGEALRTVASIMDNRAAAAIINLTGEWRNYGQQVGDSEGELKRYSITMQQGVAPALNRVSKAFAEAGGEFVKTFADPLANFMTETLTPLLKDLGSLFELFNKPEMEVKATLKIDWAKDSSTTMAYKLFFGGIQQTKEAANTTAGQAAMNVVTGNLGRQIFQAYALARNSMQVRDELVERGVLTKATDPKERDAQLARVAASLDKYREMLAASIAKAAAAANESAQNGAKAINNYLNPSSGAAGSAQGVGGLAAVGNMGFAGIRRGTPYGGTYFGGERHNGEDFFAPTGTAIKAAFTGYVTTRWSATTGHIIEQIDAAGQKLLLGHLDKYAPGLEAAIVKAGGKLLVKQGELIGYVGQTGSKAHKDLGPGNAHIHMMGYDSDGKEQSPLGMTFKPVMGGNVPFSPTAGIGKITTPAAATPYTGLTAAQIVQAQQLTAAIEKAQKAFDANPKDVGLTKALFNANQAAEAWGEKLDTNKEALALVASGQNKLNKAAGEYIATQKDLQTYGAKALQLIKDQDAAQASGNAGRILAANTALKTWQGESKARIAVTQIEESAYRTRQQAAARLKAEQERGPKLTDLQKDQATQKERLAMEALEKAIRNTSKARLEAIAKGGVTEQVSLAKWEMARAELERRAAPIKDKDLTPLQREQAAQKEAVAQEKLEKAIRNTSAARLQDIVAGGVTPEVSLAKWKAADAEIKRRADATKAEEAKANADSIARKREQQQIMAQANDQRRQLTVEGAQQSLARQEELNKQELAVFKGSAAQRLALITQQAQDEETLRERVARAIRDKRLAEIKNDTKMLPDVRQSENAQAERVYQDTLLASEGTRAEKVRTATNEQTTAIQNLRKEYSQLADGIRRQAEEGTFDSEAKQKAVKAFNDLGRAAKAAGLDTDTYITGARFSVWALVGAAEEATNRANLINLGGALVDPETGKFLYQTEEQLRGIGVAAEDGYESFYDLNGVIEDIGTFSRSELTDLVTQSGLAADEAERLYAAWDKLYGEMAGPQLADNLQGRGVTNEPDAMDAAFGILAPGERDKLIAQMDTLNLDEIGNIYAGLVLKGLQNSELGQTIADYLQGQTDATTASLLEYGGMTYGDNGQEVFQSDADLNGMNTPGDGEGQAFDVSQVDVSEYGTIEELQALIDVSKIADADAQSLRERWQEQNSALLDMVQGYDEAGKAIFATDDELRGIGVTAGDTTEEFFDMENAISNVGTFSKNELESLIVTAGLTEVQAKKLREEWERLAKVKLDEVNKQLQERVSQLQKVAQYASQAGAIFDKFSTSGKSALGVVADAVSVGFTAASKFASGDVVGGVFAVVEGIMNIGDAIEGLSPALNAWKKSLREIAEEQKKALGLSTGGIKSPWEDALRKDAEARDKLANSKWYQRLAWSIFGGAPEAMKTESAKALAEMQTIFAGFASGFNDILTTSLTTAFNNGDMSDFAANFSKSFDAQVGQLIIKTIVEAAMKTGEVANDLAELTKAVQEERYSDIPPILTRIKGKAAGIGAGVASIAPSLPGYGNAKTDATGNPTGALFGNAPGPSLGIVRNELTLPASLTGPLGILGSAAPVLLEGATELRTAVREWRAFMGGNGGPPPLSSSGPLAY